MTKAIRRPTQVYLIHGLWMVFISYKIFNSGTIFGRYLWIVGLALGIVSFANILINKAYFEIAESSIIIHQDYFRKKLINLNDVERIEIAESPFKFSCIHLKDKTKVKFNDNNVDTKKTKRVTGSIKDYS